MRRKTYIVTGGAGFIGSHLVKKLIEHGSKIICLDWLTYAGNPENLRPYLGDKNIFFPVVGEIPVWIPHKIEHGKSILGPKELPLPQLRRLKGFPFNWVSMEELPGIVKGTLEKESLVLVVGSVADKEIARLLLPLAQGVFHLAAETHVDRSILDPEAFLKTDFLGTYVMLEAFKEAKGNEDSRFLHVSTDEVYGEIPLGKAEEGSPLNPRNPYSAAKAAADRLAYSYFSTYGLNVVIARPSNNYGPFQHPEKLIPLMIARALENKKLPLYGDGMQVRDWIYVEDTAFALLHIFDKGGKGEIYNIAGHNEKKNLDVVKEILGHLGKPLGLIEFVKDRPGHDRRYALDDKKLRVELGFRKLTPFEEGLEKTVRWYIDNRDWWEDLLRRDRETAEYFKKWYKERGW